MNSYNVEGIPEYGKDLINRFMRFFRPRNVAVVGASREPGRVGYAVIKNLIDGGFKGNIYPINPRATEILGLKCYPDVRAVPEPEVDAALISIPAAMVPDVIPSLAEKKVPVAVVVSSGFAETGNVELQEKLVRTAREHGVRIIGPNTYGIYSPWYNLSLSFTIPYEFKGGLATVAQSGGVGMAAFGYARWKRIGISINVGLGNMSDIDHADLLWYFYVDENTKAISLHMESIKDGKKFIETARIVSKKKPIVVLKAGRT
ncbi:MAG: CoA-binding protein, partial [Sulfolobales archaeon]